MNIEFRKVESDDCELIFRWANDSEVRNSSFHKDPIIYEDHLRWFQNKITSQRTHIFICYFECHPIGQIRIDCENTIGLIDYSIDKRYRGRGLGTCALKYIVKYIKENNIELSKLIGRVKYDNIPSKRAFLKAGFNEMKNETFLEYVMKV